MTVFLLDNSVFQRLDRAPAVATTVAGFVERGDLLGASDSTRLEAGFSATNAEDHARVMKIFAEDFYVLPLTAEVGQVAAALQHEMFRSGHGRAAGVADLLQAATAVVHDAVLVHYDADFELLAEVEPRLQQHWVVPRGTVD